MSASDTAVQVLVASVIGVPILAFCGALGLAQLKFLLTALHHLSSPNGGLPRPVRSCEIRKFLHLLPLHVCTCELIWYCSHLVLQPGNEHIAETGTAIPVVLVDHEMSEVFMAIHSG